MDHLCLKKYTQTQHGLRTGDMGIGMYSQLTSQPSHESGMPRLLTTFTELFHVTVVLKDDDVTGGKHMLVSFVVTSRAFSYGTSASL